MERNKSGIENMKVLFGDLLDTLNLSHTELLNKMDELAEKVVVLQEAVVLSQKQVQELELKLARLQEGTHQEEAEPNKILEIEDDMAAKSEGIDNDAGFLLEEEVVTISQKELVVIPEVMSEAMPEVTPITTGDLFSQSQPELKEEFAEKKNILEALRPEWYDWEVDYPAPYIENIVEGIGFNDRILFQNELFEGDTALFQRVIAQINEMDVFQEAVEYLQTEFPHWNKQSDEVYRFYMIVRRKLRK